MVYGNLAMVVVGLTQFIVSIHRLPTPVLLGLFAYLISLYLPLSFTGIIASSIILYVILGSFTTVLTAAVTGPLVFSATAERRLIPLSTFVDEKIQPIVGVGLLALTFRQMLMVIRNPELTPFDSSANSHSPFLPFFTVLHLSD